MREVSRLSPHTCSGCAIVIQSSWWEEVSFGSDGASSYWLLGWTAWLYLIPDGRRPRGEVFQVIYGMTRGFILIGYCGFPRGYHPWNDTALDGTVPTLVCDGRKFVTDRAWRRSNDNDEVGGGIARLWIRQRHVHCLVPVGCWILQSSSSNRAIWEFLSRASPEPEGEEHQWDLNPESPCPAGSQHTEVPWLIERIPYQNFHSSEFPLFPITKDRYFHWEKWK